jgi:hypothetical protein
LVRVYLLEVLPLFVVASRRSLSSQICCVSLPVLIPISGESYLPECSTRSPWLLCFWLGCMGFGIVLGIRNVAWVPPSLLVFALVNLVLGEPCSWVSRWLASAGRANSGALLQ